MENKSYKLLLTGSQGTGKSTILNHYRGLGYNCITEVVRNLAKTGIKINEMGDKEGQEKIFETYKELFKSNPNYISDRGPTDVCAYTWHLSKTNPDLNDLATKQLEEINQFVKDNPDVVFFYFPIEFPVVDDGVRSTDEWFRTCIDQLIHSILLECNIPYIEVRGTVEERIGIIDRTINQIK